MSGHRRLEDLAVLETLIGQFLSLRAIAQRGAAALRKQHPRAKYPTGHGADIRELDQAAEIWGNAARIASEALARRRGGP